MPESPEKDAARQKAVDKRGYYNMSDIREARKDPKFRANERAVRRESKLAKERAAARPRKRD